MIDIDTLAHRVKTRRRALDSQAGEARSVLLRRREVQGEIEALTETIGILERTTLLLTSLGEERQLAAQERIEELVTRGLQTIFDDSLSFHIIQTTRGKAANVEFIVRTTLSDTVVDTSVMEARGGGLASTIGFLLRVVVMLLQSGTRDENILILDETFAMVSAEYLPAVGEFLREIVTKTGIQILMVTHQPEFEDFADRVYRFSIEEGKTVVREKS